MATPSDMVQSKPKYWTWTGPEFCMMKTSRKMKTMAATISATQAAPVLECLGLGAAGPPAGAGVPAGSGVGAGNPAA